jgi:hypothetical protein
LATNKGALRTSLTACGTGNPSTVAIKPLSWVSALARDRHAEATAIL